MEDVGGFITVLGVRGEKLSGKEIEVQEMDVTFREMEGMGEQITTSG